LALKIDSFPTDISKLNQELEKFDTLQKQFSVAKQLLNALNSQVETLKNTQQVLSSNNLVTTWNGSTLTLSWPAGYVKNNQGQLFPMTAGSRVLSPLTTYWFAWNPEHQQMSIQTDLSSLTAIPNLIIVCSVKTGSPSDLGPAGGGGFEPGGVAPSARSYVLF
jgi:hypothetical protein